MPEKTRVTSSALVARVRAGASAPVGEGSVAGSRPGPGARDSGGDQVPAATLAGLSDDVLRLRLPADDDVAAITRICQDPDIQRWTRVPSPYTEDDARSFVSLAAEALADGS